MFYSQFACIFNLYDHGLFRAFFYGLVVVAFCLPVKANFLNKNSLVNEPILNISDPANLNKDKSQLINLQNKLIVGDSAFINGNLKLAQTYYQSAQLYAHTNKLKWESALFHNRLGLINHDLKYYKKARDHHLAAYMLCSEDSVIRDTLLLLESLVYLAIYQKRIFESYTEYTNQITHLETYRPTDTIRLIKTNFLLCFFHNIVNNTKKWEYYTQLNVQMLDQNTNPYWFFQVYWEKANFFYQNGEYELSLRYWQALLRRIQHTHQLKRFEHQTVRRLITVYQLTNKHEEALMLFNTLDRYSNDGSDIRFYEDYILKGIIFHYLKQYDKAIEAYKHAEKLLINNNIRDDRLAYVLYNIGNYEYQYKGNTEAMLNYLYRAEEILGNYPKHYLESNIALVLGHYYFSVQQYALAIVYYNYILDDLDRIIEDESYFHLQYPYLVKINYFMALEQRGICFHYLSEQKNNNLHALKNSFDDFLSSIKLKERMLKIGDFEKSRISKLKSIRSAHDYCFTAGSTLYEQTQSASLLDTLFQISENGKAYLLKNFISDETAKRSANIPEHIIEKSWALQKEIDTLQYELSQKHLDVGIEGNHIMINTILQKLKTQKEFTAQLEKTYPSYAKYRNENKKVSIGQIQKSLSPNQALIEYVIAFGYCYFFYIDTDTVYMNYTNSANSINEDILQFRNIFDQFIYGNYSIESVKYYIEQSNKLYSLLIKPFEPLIKNKRLIIVPDKELSLVPFESLVTEPADSIEILNYTKLPYLLHRNPISYLYSAEQLLHAKQENRRKTTFMGFAPEYSAESHEYVDNKILKLPPLPGAQDEVQSAKQFYSGKVYSKSPIRKEDFFQACLNHDIIHLAMHATMDRDEAMNSSLIFHSDDNLSIRLHAYEVYAHKIKSSLIVLSACNTGSGEIIAGEGVFSIARAFLLAGVKNVLYTQWPITDHSSTQLMKRFYTKLARGNASDISLQQAKQDFLSEVDPVKSHPYYWAGYIHMGNPVILPSGKPNVIPVIGGLLIGALVILYFWKKRNTIV